MTPDIVATYDIGNRTGYPREKFRQAVDTLATSPSCIEERLLDASLFLCRLFDPDFPEHLQGDYRWIMKSLTDIPCGYEQYAAVEGSIGATLRGLSQDHMMAIANRILDLANELDRCDHNT